MSAVLDKYSVIEQMDRQKESNQRRKAVDSAIVSFQLEGVQPTAEFQRLADRFVDLEIDGDEFEALAEKLN